MSYALVDGYSVRQRREELGLSQQELCVEAGLSLSTLRIIEDTSDECELDRTKAETTHHQARTVKKLARVLGCHPSELGTIKGRLADLAAINVA
jgi:transcriptional regulator with XRE-family HTH domain